MEQPKFTNIYLGNGNEICMPEEYYEKIRLHCHDKGWIGNERIYVLLELEKCNYVMSEFYKTIEDL